MAVKTNKISKIVSKYNNVLLKNNIKTSKFVLYGSYAVGKENKWSDIDLVVVADNFGKRNTIERMEFLSRKAAEVDESLEVLGYTNREFDNAKDSIFGEIIANGVEVK